MFYEIVKEMKLQPVEDGFAVVRDGTTVGYVFEDVFVGWRPYSVYGHCLTCGRKPHGTVRQAAHFFA